jgi:GNAT superfamily N-acetyltransferase
MIRSAQPDDVSAISTLLEEMDRYYGATELEPAEVRAQEIGQALFGSHAVTQMLLGFDSAGALVALAAFTFLWPAAGTTRSLYLKELYVSHHHQRHGAGRQLMSRLAAAAVENGCSRMEWTTDVENLGAQEFYASLAAPVNPGKINYRVADDGLLRLAKVAETTGRNDL